MSVLKALDQQMKRMESEMKGTVDINYERYNTEIMGRVEKYNQLKKEGIKSNNNTELQQIIEKQSQVIRKGPKTRTYFY